MNLREKVAMLQDENTKLKTDLRNQPMAFPQVRPREDEHGRQLTAQNTDLSNKVI